MFRRYLRADPARQGELSEGRPNQMFSPLGRLRLFVNTHMDEARQPFRTGVDRFETFFVRELTSAAQASRMILTELSQPYFSPSGIPQT